VRQTIDNKHEEFRRVLVPLGSYSRSKVVFCIVKTPDFLSEKMWFGKGEVLSIKSPLVGF